MFARSCALLLFAAVALGGCGETTYEFKEVSTVRQLDNVLALRSDFESVEGKTRVLLLLSPT